MRVSCGELHGAPIVLDMALAPFSYGALAQYRTRGEELPVAGGFDESSALTRDPAAIERSGRAGSLGVEEHLRHGIPVDASAWPFVQRGEG